MLLNLKITYSILIIVIILIYLKKRKSGFQNRNDIYLKLQDNQKQNILNNFNTYNQQEAIQSQDIVIKKLKNSNQIIIQNYTQTENINDFQYQKNIQLKNGKLEYQLMPLENTNTLMSSMLISHGVNTSKKSKKYGFLLKLDSNFNPEHNLGEFTLDFAKKRQESIQNILEIDNIINQKTYQELPRKTVNLFTKYTAPSDLLPYFTKGTHDKDIKILI